MTFFEHLVELRKRLIHSLIALNDGSTVRGKVTPRTEIECASAMASAADNDNGGHDGERGDDNSSGPGPGGEQSSGRDNDNDNDAGDDDAQDEAEHCTTAALVLGASVREAVLSVGGAGALWVKLEL